MKEVLDSLLNAEARAKQMISQAEVQTTRMATEAKEKARELIQKRRDQAYQEGLRLQDETRRQAETDHREQLEKAHTESLRRARIDPAIREKAVELACKLFTETGG